MSFRSLLSIAVLVGGCGSAPAGNRCHDCTLGDVPAPRPIAPLSTARATSGRPTLRVQLASGTSGADVEICRDRSCSQLIEHLEVDGESVRPSARLPSGVVFWRAFGHTPSLHGTTPGPTFELVVPAGDAPVDGSWGTLPDFDGDGLADVVVTGQYVDGNTGRLYLYRGSTDGIAATPTTTRTGPDGPNGEFGCTVRSAGDVDGDSFADLAVGAPWAQGSQGRVYLFRGSAHGIAETPLALSSPTGGQRFGAKVAWAGDVDGDGYADLLVAEPGVDFEAPGRAWLFFGAPNGFRDGPTMIAPPDGAAQLGAAIAGLGDVDGDGFADVGIGYFHGAAASALLYRGSASGLVEPPVTIDLPGGGVIDGAVIRPAGDVNGDGYGDVVTGGYDATLGQAQLWLGSPSGLVPSVTVSSGLSDDEFGVDAAWAGDVDHDGFDDVLVGTNEHTAPRHVYLYRGSPSGLGTTPMIVLARSERSFGMTLDGTGDVDGDGIDDWVVGAMDDVAAFVWTGSAAGPSAAPRWSMKGPDLGGFGGGVARPHR